MTSKPVMLGMLSLRMISLPRAGSKAEALQEMAVSVR
jgi:hypothetical protein